MAIAPINQPSARSAKPPANPSGVWVATYTRTPARPIEMYEAKMKRLGKTISVHWFETGHLGSFAQTDLAIEHQEMMLRFAYSVLG